MAQDPLIGQQLGNYRIDRLLGQGGMSRVYLGWDVHLDRPVAVKVISEQYRDDPAYNQRFLREARAMASWQHPNIAQVHYAGIENGLAYFVMEYISGQDLARALRQYASQGLLLPYSEVLRIGTAVASALDYAHRRGIIHRDVKPSNVMISEDGRVLLTDFGLAMNMTEGTLGEVFGSPQYIAPEQARSSANAVPQSDLYSLGVMLYEMLVGRVPFIDPNPTTLALQHIQQEPPDPRTLNPDLSPAIQAFLSKALNKQPDQRFQSGREMIRALEQALADPVAAEATAPMPALRTPGIRGEVDPAPTATHLPPIFPPRAAGRPPTPPPPTRRGSSFGRWATGCLLALLLIAAAAVVILAFNFENPNSLLNVQRTRQAAGIPATPKPSQTLSPTETLAPTDEPTAIPTETATPTETPTPTATPQILGFELVKMRSGDVIMVNRSTVDLPLKPIQFTSKNGDFNPIDFELDVLRENECTLIYPDKINTTEAETLKCTPVGKPLHIKTNTKFWTQAFYVNFNNERLGTCTLRDNKPCEFRFILSDTSPQPYP